MKHRGPREAQAWRLLITCCLSYHEHKKKKEVRFKGTPKGIGTWQVTKPRADAHRVLLSQPATAASQQTNYSHHHKHIGVATFQLCGLCLPSLGTFFENMTSQAYFLLKIYTKTKYRATKYSQMSTEGECLSVDVLPLSFLHSQCTKQNLPWELFIFGELLQGGA